MEYVEGKTFEAGDDLILDGTEFVECTFIGLDLAEREFKNSKFIECHFRKCNCSNAVVQNSTFRDTKFDECKLMGINWSSVQSIANLSIQNSNLDYSVFQELNLGHAIFKDCVIREVDFSQSKMESANFSGSNLRGSFFTGCDLSKADFRDAIEYNIDPQFTKLKKAKFSMPEAMSLLQSLEIIIE